VDARGVQAASGKAEEESDTGVVSATTTTQPVVVWASWAPPKIYGRPPNSRPYGRRQSMALRFGLLGTGYWAAHTHAAALAAHPGVDFVGVWGRDPAKAADLARRYAVRPYGSVDALLAAVDAVAVALPPDVQADLAARAAAAGRHLLLDKPLAFSTAAADRVVDAVERNHLVARVFFTLRYQPTVATFLARVGRLSWDGARATHFASIFEPGGPYAGSPWRRSHGGLWDIGPHALSILLPVLGPVDQVVATPAPRDTTHVLLQHRGGAGSVMSLTLDAPAAATTHEVVLHGEEGFATVPAGGFSEVEAAVAAVDELVDAVAAGRPAHPCDARFGRDVVAVLAAADTARRLGCAVRPDQGDPGRGDPDRGHSGRHHPDRGDPDRGSADRGSADRGGPGGAGPDAGDSASGDTAGGEPA
jgi:predicted dehydrogenase